MEELKNENNETVGWIDLRDEKKAIEELRKVLNGSATTVSREAADTAIQCIEYYINDMTL